MTRRRLALRFSACAVGVLAFLAADAVAAPARNKPAAKGKAVAAKTAKPAKTAIPIPRPRPASAPAPRLASAAPVLVPEATAIRTGTSASPAQPLTYREASLQPVSVGELPTRAAGPSLPSVELAAVKQAMALIRRGKADEAYELSTSLRDPAARKLVEWAVLRSDSTHSSAERYLTFIAANPGWPGIGLFRKRAEGSMWDDRASVAAVRNFFASAKPITAKGRLALARALLAQGDTGGAQHFAREAYRTDALSQELESQAIETFGSLLTGGDHKARMDRCLYGSGDSDCALRMAKRLGNTQIAIAKARIAVSAKADNAGALLDAVPEEARGDPGYMFSRIQWLRRNDRFAEAARLMLAVPNDPAALHNLDEWWIERRLLSRKMLDENDAPTAYQIARDAVPPTRENYRGEHQFTAGWIALRFLNNPQVALPHFVRVGHGTTNPMTLARANYWQGRAHEALGRTGEARGFYQAAARYPTAYYGQIARARLGITDLSLREPDLSPAHRAATLSLDVVRAAEILYAVGEREMMISFATDFGDKAHDVAAIVAVGDIIRRNEDARSMLAIGKNALARGLPVDAYAFPDVGVPNVKQIGPEIDRATVYAIVRQESAFNQRDYSPAHAMGLMQVTPEAGKYVAKKFNVTYDQKKLRNDPVYNTQMGAAELGDLIKDYRGSYILSFAGYNAGRGRIRDWVARFGDPRDPNVDPIDWVERIPFSETRNYVQRVMENMQVYRVRFGHGNRLLIEADMRLGTPQAN